MNSRAQLLLVLAAIVFTAAACGGSSISPPPLAGNFSNASLNGPYAFSMSGEDPNGGFFARVGSFAADGSGGISAGLADVVDGSSAATLVSITGGSYSIEANGQGVLSLQPSTGTPLQFSITLLGSTQGLLVETDLKATSSGNFTLQTTSSFGTTALNGKFVLDFAGVSFTAAPVAPLSIIGEVALDGTGIVTGGTLDENDGTLSGAIAAQAGSYELDAGNNGSAFGRGTMSFDARNFVFYIVNSSRIKVVEEDLDAATMGDANRQSGAIPTQNSSFTGSFVYLVQGASVLGNAGDQTRLARFTADGNGGIAALSYDENNNGSSKHISQGSNISKSTYAIDSANSGSGRGTFTFTDSGGGTYTYIFYMSSPGGGVVQDTSPGIIADGPLEQQSGSPFSASSLAGNYAFNWSGTALGTKNAITLKEDYVGRYILASTASSNVTGAMDYTQLGLSGDTLYTDVGIAGGLTINSDGTLNNTLVVASGGTVSTTYNFAFYVVSPETSYMICTDSTRVTGGIAIAQTQ